MGHPDAGAAQAPDSTASGCTHGRPRTGLTATRRLRTARPGRQPRLRGSRLSSSRSSARWVCRRTSSRSASSAVAAMTRADREGRARGEGDAYHGPGSGSWWAATAASLSQHRVFVLADRCRRPRRPVGHAHRPPGRVEAAPDPRAARSRPRAGPRPRPGGRRGGRWTLCTLRGRVRPGRRMPRGRPPPRRCGPTGVSTRSQSNSADPTAGAKHS